MRKHLSGLHSGLSAVDNGQNVVFGCIGFDQFDNFGIHLVGGSDVVGFRAE